MQIHELVQLGRRLKALIEDNKLVSEYDQLISAVNQAAQNQNPHAVNVRLENLKQLLEQIEQDSLTPAQAKLMAEYGGDKLLGRRAIERLDDIFSRHKAHPQGLASAIQTLRNETSELASKATQLVRVVEPIVEEVKDEEQLEEGEGRLWLYFADAASVDTIDDLETAAETWKQILHHFSRLPGASAVPARILQIHKYSPLELELAAHMALLAPLAVGVQWVLSRMEQVIRIRQEAEKLKQLQIKTKIVEDLYAEAEAQKQKLTAEAADEVQRQFNADNEARNAVEAALRSVVAFVTKGGQLDIDVDETDEETEEEGATPDGKEGGASRNLSIKSLMEAIHKDMKLLPGAAGEETDT